MCRTSICVALLSVFPFLWHSLVAPVILRDPGQSPIWRCDWDDTNNFLNNTRVLSLTWENARWWITHDGILGVYEPLGLALKALLMRASGLFIADLGASVPPVSPWLFCVVACTLHATCAFLACEWASDLHALQCLKLQKPKNANARGISWVTAFVIVVLFGVHPTRVETLFWVSANGYPSSGLCCLICARCHLRTLLPTATFGSRVWWGSMSMVAYVGALGFKTVAVPWPVVLFIIDLMLLDYREAQGFKSFAILVTKVLGRLAHLFVLAALGARVAVQATATAQEGIIGMTHGMGLAKTARALFWYVEKALWPHNLCVAYELPRLNTGYLVIPWRESLAKCFVIGVWVLLLIVRVLFPPGKAHALSLSALSTESRSCMAATGIFVALLLPTIGVIGAAHGHPVEGADRYSYFVAMSVSPVLGILLSNRAETILRHRKLYVTLAFVYLALAVSSWSRAHVWVGAYHPERSTQPPCFSRDESLRALCTAEDWFSPRHSHLWTQCAARNPASFLCQSHLGNYLRKIGNTRGAIDVLTKVLSMVKSDDKEVYGPTSFNLGNYYMELGDANHAKRFYEQACSVFGFRDPDLVHTWSTAALSGLGLARAQLGDKKGGMEAHAQAVAQSPKDVTALTNYGSALASVGQTAEAIGYLREAVAVAPPLSKASAEAYFTYGYALKVTGDLPAAVSAYQKALQVQPQRSDLHLNLGVAFQSLGRIKDSKVHFLKAVALGHPKSSQIQNQLSTMQL